VIFWSKSPLFNSINQKGIPDLENSNFSLLRLLPNDIEKSTFYPHLLMSIIGLPDGFEKLNATPILTLNQNELIFYAIVLVECTD
jgi:predicted permease